MHQFYLADPHFLPHIGCEIELTLTPGKLLTLVGENGIGKSTLLKRIAESETGKTTHVEQKALDVFYDRPLWKIKEILLSSRKDEVSRDFFHSLWEKFHLVKKENRFQSTLSGGEGQALKMVLGLSMKADCFLLDEPSQFLDQDMKKVLNEVIFELLQMNKTLLVVEHDYEWLKVPNSFVQLGVADGVLKKVKSWST